MSSELPDGWILKPLGEVSEIKIGGTPSRSDPTFWSSEGHYWASIADLLQNPITRTKERISDAGVLASNVKPIKAGTVLMSFKLTIGRVALAGVDLFTNEAIAAFAPDEEQLDPGFLYHALPGTASRAETDTAVKGKTLNKTKLRNLSIALPPLHEQRKIAEILSSVDEVIRANEAVIEQTERVKQATLRKLLTKGIEQTRFKQTEIGEIPESWEVVAIGDISKFTSGKLKSKKSLSTCSTIRKAIPVYGGNGINGYTESENVEGQRVIVGRVGEYCGATYYTNQPIWVTDNALFTKWIAERVKARFLYLALLGNDVSRLRSATGQPLISQKPLHNLRIGLPPPEEQAEIIEIVHAMDGTLEDARSCLMIYRGMKGAIASQLLSGSKRVAA